MSGARHLHTPPHPRTEVEVAADAIVAILDARIVPRTPSMIGRLSIATGVPVAMIKKAWESKEAGYGGLRPTRRPIADQPREQPAVEPVMPEEPPAPPPVRMPAKPQGGAAHRNSTRTAAAYRQPGMRRCSKCEAVKSVDEFDWKDRKKGYRRSWCRECWNAYQRERWLSVEKTKRLGLAFALCRLRRRSPRGGLQHLPLAARDGSGSCCERREALSRQLLR